MSSGGVIYGTPIPFRLSHQYEPADAMAWEAGQALTQPLATGCSGAELLRAWWWTWLLKEGPCVPWGRRISKPFSLNPGSATIAWSERLWNHHVDLIFNIKWYIG